ncbi:MAG TPA: hypothetical protein VGX94_08020 [Terriglobia bacterium]|nr:hypothetical protein [Terriglobia bacterium]
MKLPDSKALDRYSNLAVIIVAFVFIAWFVESHFIARRVITPNTSPVGKRINLSSVSQPPALENVVLGLSTVCHFCQMNTDLYKHLAGMEAPGRISVVAVIPQSESEAKQYLAKDGLQASFLAGKPLSTYDITGTPTILLLDSKGIIRKAWIGALTPTQQNDVISTVQHGF